jgi:class 3 adenylate cyclase
MPYAERVGAIDCRRDAARVVKELVYRLDLELSSSPEQLWPLVADTDRFNRDSGIPPVQRVVTGRNARRRLRLSRLGVAVEWEEEPFEWVRPHRFSVIRRYSRGPIELLRTSARLEPRPGGGTLLVYEVRVRARNVFGKLAAQLEIGVLRSRRFAAVLRGYDKRIAVSGSVVPPLRPTLAPGGRERLAAARAALLGAGVDADLVERLCHLVQHGDDQSLQRLRPYVLADAWGWTRRDVLAACLQATRAGLLDLRWQLLCPLCRGPAATGETLDAAGNALHCETCRIDFSADLQRSVELTFAPTAVIRAVQPLEFCVGGPQLTPHILVQQLVEPKATRVVDVSLEPGRYRLRALAASGGVEVACEAGGARETTVHVDAGGWRPTSIHLATDAVLTLVNAGDDEQLFVLERTEWADDAATAAEVTVLQVYRDLFAAEALRLHAPISVERLTVVFTDLRGSTRFYREIGDAPAFGSVLDHIALLRQVVAAEDGAVVKQMGDAIMAVFVRPVSALHAMFEAQRRVAGRPLALKVGIHSGRCIAVNQNGVLDYFGSTVNLAARLVALASGDDLVVSGAILDDPEVRALGLQAERVEAVVRGFEDEAPSLWRVLPSRVTTGRRRGHVRHSELARGM